MWAGVPLFLAMYLSVIAEASLLVMVLWWSVGGCVSSFLTMTFVPLIRR
jgi:hypothetical protein